MEEKIQKQIAILEQAQKNALLQDHYEIVIKISEKLIALYEYHIPTGKEVNC